MECTKCHLPNELAKGKRWCKICKNKYELERKAKNNEHEIRKEKDRQYYHNKKEQILKQNIEMVEEGFKECSVCKITKPINKDNFFMAKCKGHIRAMCKACSSLDRKEYYLKNKKAVNKQVTQYQVERMKRDPLFKLERRLRSRIYDAFTAQNKTKTNRTWKYIDCSPPFFQKWIEFQLYDGMTLDNYGKIWHIDHVKPCSSFNLENESEVKECFCWKNLRPYLANKNLEKSDKLQPFDILMQELKVYCFQKIVK